MTISSTWPHRSQQAVKTLAFEIRVEIGSDDPEATKALMNAIGELIQTKATQMFPQTAAPPCRGCGEGRS
jgi:hypothetical protein